MTAIFFSYIYSFLGCSDANIIQSQSMMLEEGQDARLVSIQDYGFSSINSSRIFRSSIIYIMVTSCRKTHLCTVWMLTQPMLDRCLLSISAVKPEDSAGYFCASRETIAYQKIVFFLQKTSPFVFNLWIFCGYKSTLVFSTKLSYVISTKLENWTQAIWRLDCHTHDTKGPEIL